MFSWLCPPIFLHMSLFSKWIPLSAIYAHSTSSVCRKSTLWWPRRALLLCLWTPCLEPRRYLYCVHRTSNHHHRMLLPIFPYYPFHFESTLLLHRSLLFLMKLASLEGPLRLWGVQQLKPFDNLLVLVSFPWVGSKVVVLDKIVALDVIYNFVAEKFFNWNGLGSQNFVVSSWILKFKI